MLPDSTQLEVSYRHRGVIGDSNQGDGAAIRTVDRHQGVGTGIGDAHPRSEGRCRNPQRGDIE